MKTSYACGRCGEKERSTLQEYCRACLCELVEKKAKKALYRIAGWDRAVQIVLCTSQDDSLNARVAGYLIKKITGKEPIIREKLSGHKEKLAVVTAVSADETGAELIRWLTGESAELCPSASMLRKITEAQLEIYAQTKKIKYTGNKKIAFRKNLEDIQARYPGTAEALANASEILGTTLFPEKCDPKQEQD